MAEQLIVRFSEVIGFVVQVSRELARFSRQQMADEIGVGKSTMCRLEEGRGPITAAQLGQIGAVLGVAPCRILFAAEVMCEAIQKAHKATLVFTSDEARDQNNAVNVSKLHGAAKEALRKVGIFDHLSTPHARAEQNRKGKPLTTRPSKSKPRKGSVLGPNILPKDVVVKKNGSPTPYVKPLTPVEAAVSRALSGVELPLVSPDMVSAKPVKSVAAPEEHVPLMPTTHHSAREATLAAAGSFGQLFNPSLPVLPTPTPASTPSASIKAKPRPRLGRRTE